MEIEAIGRPVTPRVGSAANNILDQSEFIQLFVDQLRYQDPLEPVDNREFLAQLATFSNVQQNADNGSLLEGIATVSSVNQGVSLLGRTVQASTTVGVIVGEVTQVDFSSEGPRLTLKPSIGASINNIRLSQIMLIRE